MPNIMRGIAPSEQKFFEMLAEQSKNALLGAKELKGFVSGYSELERGERKTKSHSIRLIENKGDEITRSIMEKLNRAFRAPADKHEIQQIAIFVDDIMDLINSVSLRFVLFGIERVDSHMIKLADIVEKIVGELSFGILDLMNNKGMEEHYLKIRNLEKEADDSYQEALSELFHFYKNSIDIIKYKEIYGLMEEITDKCEDAAHVIESISIKRA